jgi:hypothetical protein
MIDKELTSKSLPTSWMASARFKARPCCEDGGWLLWYIPEGRGGQRAAADGWERVAAGWAQPG